jgi:hypothetical protein
MEPSDRSEVADLICTCTNYWYRIHGGSDLGASSIKTALGDGI